LDEGVDAQNACARSREHEVLLERFEDKGLAQFSYAIGCEAAGTIAIVDPRRDVDVYLAFAHARDLRITDVLETHIHADFASGARELAARSGAELWLSAYDRGELYEAAFAHRPMHDGEALTLGRVRIEARHTPGHTPEHLSFLAYDLARAPATPEVLLSGDFLFVGSLGRPDLIGESAKMRLAGQLHDSVTRVLPPLPDLVEVHPAHGAGSMCGSGMGARPMSTLGYERVANPYLRQNLSRNDFISEILAHVPPFPPYYKRMKVLNARGAAGVEPLPGLHPVAPRDFRNLVESGHVVIDLRDQLSFGAGHIPDAFGIGADGQLSMWAGWVVPYETPLLLVASDPTEAEDAVRQLVRVGLDDVRGYLDGGMEKWIEAGYRVAHTRQATPSELADELSRRPVEVLDVRSDEEWRSGHVPGARHVMGGYLADQVGTLPRDGTTLAVICASGYRSTVAASVLERAGFASVASVTGGMAAWQHAGLGLEKDDTPGTPGTLS
jgi:hydroxyacylglutathione hydrolase